MKIQLENLAPYLPYKLRFQDLIHKTNKSFQVLTPLTLSFNRDGICNIKPMLRPISDLTKEIEVNGEKFIPLECIGDVVNIHCDKDFITDWHERGGNFLDYIDEFINGKWNNHHLHYLPFGFVQKLFEWHFDVFGLIDKGLAIDINTLRSE